ncbi:ATP-binding cassette domain-containing protein [Paenibacillus sp. 32O-W]|uniref:ATP-binding cassette domain-containing protein n=1 Tax=Paenibacillus sp. 32O-W TaxID=1695218 RepID=UPI0011A1BA56|nr:ATP-binding cassette domain-containing protein [Paenibacillus sp. 32O-W]
MDLRLEGIGVTSPKHKETWLLREVTSTLHSGSLTLLVGRTGAGKSTLLDIVAGLTEPSEGTIALGGEPFWNRGRISRDILRRSALVFQSPEQQLFARTVLQEFKYSLKPLRLSPEEEKRRIAQALSIVGLSEELLGENPLTLSGGQKRRVALATAFACRPEWLLLDEPTAGLDGEGLGSFARYIETWKRETGAGIVLATHDLDTFLPMADFVWIINDGTVSATVPGEELLRRPELLLEAGLLPPDGLRAAELLKRQGLKLPSGWLAPEQLAAAIALALHARAGSDAAAQENGPSPIAGATEQEYDPALIVGPTAQNGLAQGDSTIAQGKSNASVVGTTVQGTNNASVVGTTGRGKKPMPGVGNDPRVAKPFPAATEASRETASVTKPAAGAPVKSWLQSCDPRSIWVVYMLISVGILLQRSWAGVAAGLIITAAALAGAKAGWRPVRRLASGFLLFMVLSSVVAGLRLSVHGTDGFHLSIGFSMQAAQQTMLQLSRIWCLLLIGALLPLAVGSMRMKQGLEQGLSFLKRIRLPVEALALSVALVFRFIPLIFSEWERFSRIARARAKSGSKPGRIALRELPAVLIPLLASLLHLADQFSSAMEIRGYTGTGMKRTSGVMLKIEAKDWTFIACGLFIFAMLFLIRLWS